MRGKAPRLLVWLALGHVGLAGLTGPVDAADSAVTVTTMSYKVPGVQLTRDDGRKISLPDELNDGRAVVLNFIFTTCSSLCPLSSQTFAQFQRRLGAESRSVHLVSISTDPEQDTPARLREYAKKFGARPGWEHYTGTLEASVATQRAFDAYLGDKMSHAPVTWIRAAHDTTWHRVDGFLTPAQLMREYRRVEASRESLAAK